MRSGTSLSRFLRVFLPTSTSDTELQIGSLTGNLFYLFMSHFSAASSIQYKVQFKLFASKESDREKSN